MNESAISNEVAGFHAKGCKDSGSMLYKTISEYRANKKFSESKPTNAQQTLNINKSKQLF